jgi:hypothetical protein
VRVWDLSPVVLCRHHLLAEHREVHALWVILTQDKGGYASHPEVRRWRGKLRALHARHDALAGELLRRGYRHASPLPPAPMDSDIQEELVDSIETQILRLQAKRCGCRV